MKYFLDSAILSEIDYAFVNFGIDGVTTNPRHIMLSGNNTEKTTRELAAWVLSNHIEGAERFPISIEINPHLDRWEDMYEEGKRVSALSPNFVVKIPCTEQGLIAARRLELDGIRTNVTLVFSRSQAIPAGRLGAKFVSPFIGWKENSGEDTYDYIKDIVQIYKNYDFRTKIIVAAVRTGKAIADSAKIGADIVTCGLDIIRNSIYHPYTDYGLNLFCESWDQSNEK